MSTANPRTHEPATPGSIPDTTHGRIFALLEKLGVSYAVGKAVEAILEAADCETPDARAAELLHSALARLGVPAGQVVHVLSRWDTADEPAPEAPPAPQRDPAPQPAPAAPRKPRRTPGRSVKPAAQGKGGFRAGRTCTKCGKAKGVTAFPKGKPEVCRLCLAEGTGPAKKPRAAGKDAPDADPLNVGNPSKASGTRAPAVIRRRCSKCGEMRPLQVYPNGGSVCRGCASVRAVRGSVLGHTGAAADAGGNGADGGA